MKYSPFKVTAPTLPSNDFRATIPISSNQDFEQRIKRTSGWVSFETKKDIGILEEVLGSNEHVTGSSVTNITISGTNWEYSWNRADDA